VRRLPLLASLLVCLLTACQGAPSARTRAGRLVPVLSAESLPPPGLALMGGSAAVWHGRDLLVGGLEDDLSQPAIWQYRPGHPLTVFGQLPTASHDHAAVAVGGSLWIFGGGDASGSLATLARVGFDGQGVSVGHLPEPLSDLAAAPLGSSVLVIGGYNGTAPSTSVYRFSPDRLSLAPFATLPVGLRYAAVATLGPLVYVAGGLTEHGYTDRVLAIDRAGRVRTVARLPVALRYASAFTFGGALYVVGGQSQEGLLADVYRVDVARGRVTLAARLPSPFAYGYLFRNGDRVYLVDGLGPDGQATDRAEELTLGWQRR
jgi:hypothetical protein